MQCGQGCKNLVTSLSAFPEPQSSCELPALEAGQLWQGPLSLPAAGTNNFLSPLRAQPGVLHLISHQTLCFVLAPKLGVSGCSQGSFLDQPPCRIFVPDHQYTGCVVCVPRQKSQYHFTICYFLALFLVFICLRGCSLGFY